MRQSLWVAWRALASERGVVLLAVMAAVLIITLLLAALALSTMSETGISRRQLGGAQALFLAEAGAYRALAELRHRLSVAIDAPLSRAGGEELLALCEADEAWRLVARFARPPEGSDWEEDPAAGEAVLRLGGGEPISVRTPQGGELGQFQATVRIRPARSAKPRECSPGDELTPDHYLVWLAYEIEASGVTPRARRAVRLSSPPEIPIPLLVERAGVARWGLLVLGASEVWLTDALRLNGSAHTNGQWWIRGRPTFAGPVTSAAEAMRFWNCGTPLDLPEGRNAGSARCEGDRPRYLGGPPVLAAPTVDLTAQSPNPARAALGLAPFGADPSDEELRLAAADRFRRSRAVAPGVYVANQDGILRHPQTQQASGIYIRGDVRRMGLVVEGNKQAIQIELAGQRRAESRIVIDPEGESLRVEGDDGAATYRGAGNGVIYVEGAIQSIFGTVQADMRLTVAARRAITVTDHLVYQRPPGARAEPANLLGLYSREGDVQVDGSAAPHNLFIDAVILAPRGRLETPGIDLLPDRGVLRVLGAVIQRELGEVGAFGADAGARRGYRLALRHDQRLLQTSPPFFPLTDRYVAPRPHPDPLYDKPVWEEIPVP